MNKCQPNVKGYYVCACVHVSARTQSSACEIYL